jgi:DNA replication protein DnaC
MIDRQIRAAKSPTIKTVGSFEFTAIPWLNKMLVLDLARGAYIERRENIIALSPNGTCKIHIALVLGLAACQRGFTTGFVTAAGVVQQLMEARDEKRLFKLQAQLASIKLLIVDEFGYVPLSLMGSELLFEVFSQRYERGSVIVASHLPFEEWISLFSCERLTGALLDRLTHHVHIGEMNGDNYRLKQSQGRRRKTPRSECAQDAEQTDTTSEIDPETGEIISPTGRCKRKGRRKHEVPPRWDPSCFNNPC